MPTGYTCNVQDGKITEFRDYAKACARAFGANILMRDDPADAPIEEYKPASYHFEWLESAKEKLETARKMTVAEAKTEIARRNRDTASSLLKSQEENRVTRERYETMLSKVRAWSPPTPDHTEFKNFMISQLEDSLRHDCHDMTSYYCPITETPEEFIASEILDGIEEVLRYEQSLAEEIDRTKGRNSWNQALFQSLK
jgi:hypothetical protein